MGAPSIHHTNRRRPPARFVDQIEQFARIVVREHRLPGRCYQAYYDLLHALGMKTATIRVGRGVRLKGFTSCLSIAQEVWSKKVYDHPGFVFDDTMHIIDIGANQGFFAAYAASFGSRVYAFEPSSENFAMLTHNIDANSSCGRVQASRMAVARTKGTATLFVGLDSHGESLSASAGITNSNRGGTTVKAEQVSTTTFEGILSDYKIPACDFLKIDCEGAEYGILQSISPEGFSRIGRVSMETHDGKGREALNMLKSHGFVIIEFEDSEAGFIKAYNPRFNPRS